MKVKLKEIVSDFIVPMRNKPKTFDGLVPWCRIEDVKGKYLSRSLSNHNVSEQVIDEMNLKVYPVGIVVFPKQLEQQLLPKNYYALTKHLLDWCFKKNRCRIPLLLFKLSRDPI